MAAGEVECTATRTGTRAADEAMSIAFTDANRASITSG
jgi:hypothetical protein